VHTLKGLNLSYPAVDETKKKELAAAEVELKSEGRKNPASSKRKK